MSWTQFGRPKRIIDSIKRWVPRPIWSLATSPYWWWYDRANHQLAGFMSAKRRASVRNLLSLRDVHLGERCFIIGNGPSLQDTDLEKLRGEYTFGLNRIYLLFPELGFQTSYYVSINTLVIEQCAQDIHNLSMPKFLTWRGRKWVNKNSDVIFLDTDYTPPSTFAQDVTGRVFEGSTVTYVALQLAFHMGFKDVILVGVDHQFASIGLPNETIVSNGDDPNHFSPDYFGKGFRWQLPDLEASERAYVMARDNYQSNGRRILDATVGGKLDIFPKICLEDLF